MFTFDFNYILKDSIDLIIYFILKSPRNNKILVLKVDKYIYIVIQVSLSPNLDVSKVSFILSCKMAYSLPLI